MDIRKILKNTLFLSRSLDDFENYLTPGVDYPIIASTASAKIAQKYPDAILYQKISKEFLFYDETFFNPLLYKFHRIQDLEFDAVWMHRAYPWLDDLRSLGKMVFAIEYPLYQKLNSKFGQYKILSDYCDSHHLPNFIKEKQVFYGTRLLIRDPERFCILAKEYGLPFVMAGAISDAGNRIFLITGEADYRRLIFEIKSPVVRIEAYMKDAIPISQTAVVFADQTIACYQHNLQLITNTVNPNNFEFVGAEFNVDSIVSKAALDNITALTRRIGQCLHSFGFLGMFGCDFMVHDDRAFFMELNPRYHASTFMLTRQADFEIAPHTLHILSFLKRKAPEKVHDTLIRVLDNHETGFSRHYGPVPSDARAPGIGIRIKKGLPDGFTVHKSWFIEDPRCPVKLSPQPTFSG